MLKPEIRKDLKEIQTRIKEAQQVSLVCHVNADGDALGSISALYHRFHSQVSQVNAFVFEPIPERYEFLGLHKIVQQFDGQDQSCIDKISRSDLVFVLDLAVIERLPGWEGILSDYQGTIVCIDHHPEPENPIGHINIIDSNVAATGQLIYEFFQLENKKLKYEEALAIFTAIATDTGWFRYSNTTPDVMAIAAKLLESDLAPAKIFSHIYQSNDIRHVKLTGFVANHVRSEMDNRFLWAVIPKKIIQESGLKDLENEELLDIFRSVKGCACVALFREAPDGKVRVNLRSKGDLAINKLAERFGGGGHRNAAGVTLNCESIDKAAEQVVEAVKEFMADQGY